MSLETLFNKAWYGKNKWTQVFRPVLPLVSYLVAKKRRQFLADTDKHKQVNVPVIVVGNISVGGTGKSPMVLALIEALKLAGYYPGIVSRGYGVSAANPIRVTPESLANECGDEPVMLVRRSRCPMVICQNRVDAINVLLEDKRVDLVISDDGMQHYAMARDIELLMLDAKRGLGNGALLPVGPLREPASRVLEVDYVISLVSEKTQPDLERKKQEIRELLLSYQGIDNAEILDSKLIPASVSPQSLVNLKTGEHVALEVLKSFKQCSLVAGIGNPERFLNTLLEAGLPSGYTTSWFGDHHKFSADDVAQDNPVVMTEKDAVKCKDLNLDNDNVWYLPIEVGLPAEFIESLTEKLISVSSKE